MRRGRPSKLTPETQQKLLSAIAAGNHLNVACGFAGVSYKVFREWMIKGEAEAKGEFRNFREAVRQVEVRTEIELVAAWRSHCKTDWRSVAEFLSRRFPDRWSNSQRVKIEVAKEIDQTLDRLESRLPPEIFEQVLIAIADEDSDEPETLAV